MKTSQPRMSRDASPLFRVLAFLIRALGGETRTNGSNPIAKTPTSETVAPFVVAPREPFITGREPRFLSTRELLRLGALATLITIIPAALSGLLSTARPDVYGGRV